VNFTREGKQPQDRALRYMLDKRDSRTSEAILRLSGYPTHQELPSVAYPSQVCATYLLMFKLWFGIGTLRWLPRRAVDQGPLRLLASLFLS
jgi:hypothetical protein